MEASSSAPPPQTAVTLRSSAQGREGGKVWKLQKAATRRSMLAPGLKTRPWEARKAQRTQEEAVRKLAKEMKDEKQADIDRIKKINLDRKKAKEEKARLEAMAVKLSAKKIARLKKRAGRSKKVKG